MHHGILKYKAILYIPITSKIYYILLFNSLLDNTQVYIVTPETLVKGTHIKSRLNKIYF